MTVCAVTRRGGRMYFGSCIMKFKVERMVNALRLQFLGVALGCICLFCVLFVVGFSRFSCAI